MCEDFHEYLRKCHTNQCICPFTLRNVTSTHAFVTFGKVASCFLRYLAYSIRNYPSNLKKTKGSGKTYKLVVIIEDL